MFVILLKEVHLSKEAAIPWGLVRQLDDMMLLLKEGREDQMLNGHLRVCFLKYSLIWSLVRWWIECYNIFIMYRALENRNHLVYSVRELDDFVALVDCWLWFMAPQKMLKSSYRSADTLHVVYTVTTRLKSHVYMHLSNQVTERIMFFWVIGEQVYMHLGKCFTGRLCIDSAVSRKNGSQTLTV